MVPEKVTHKITSTEYNVTSVNLKADQTNAKNTNQLLFQNL